jgi:hypothetical protein
MQTLSWHKIIHQIETLQNDGRDAPLLLLLWNNYGEFF